MSKPKRACLPREWSSQDDRFYKQVIHQAQNINHIPSSLAYDIAEIVRNTSVHRSDWKIIARSLGLDNEGVLRNIEDASRYRQELPLYIALTTQYMVNPAASLGALLESLMKLKRHDILIRIKDDVEEFVCQHRGWKSANNSFSSHQVPVKQPVEEDSTCDISRCQETVKAATTSSHLLNCHCCNPHKDYEKDRNYDSAFYEQQSAPNSLLKILNMNDEIIKEKSTMLFQKDKCYNEPVWKQQNKAILENRTPSFKKADSLKTTDFQFVDPTNKTQSLSESESGFISAIPSINYSRENEDEDVKTRDLVAAHVTNSARTNTELMDSYSYDSDSTYDEDFDLDLTGQQKFPEETFNGSNKYATLKVDSDTRRIQQDVLQNLSISDYKDTEQYSGSENETYDINNSVNERIDYWVSERNASIRHVEEAEREPHATFLDLETQTVKKPHEYLLSSLKSVLPPGTSITADSIKVIVVHSEDDGDTAIDIASALVKEFQMVAVAECQLSPIWHLDPNLFKRTALYWADVIIPLITNKWLEDISNEKPLQQRETASLNARAVFKILQTMFMNRGSVNLSCIPAVMEGTSCKFRNYPEIREAIRLSKDIYDNGSIKKLGNLISGFHALTKDAKREAKTKLLE